MKIKNLLFFSLILLLATSLKSQDMFIGEVKVKVEDNTLLYVTNELRVDNSDDATERANFYTDVDGWVEVGSFNNISSDASDVGEGVEDANANDIASFRLQDSGTGTELDKSRQGGELIINGSSAGVAEIVRTPLSGDFTQFAVPFNGLTPDDLVAQFGGTAGAFTSGAIITDLDRARNTFFFWDNGVNSGMPSYYNYANGTTAFQPGEYIIVNNLSFATGAVAGYSGINGMTISPEGVPNGGDVTIPLTDYSATYDYGTNAGASKNSFEEPLNTYIVDVSDPTGCTNCGEFQYQLGNPFTSNIDLSYIHVNSETNSDANNFTNIRGISVAQNGGYDDVNGSTSNVSRVVLYGGGVPVGDIDELIVPPLYPFYIQFNSAPSSSFVFNTNLKTFLDTPAFDGNPTGVVSSFAPTEGDVFAPSYSSSSFEAFNTSFSTNSVFEIGLTLFSQNDLDTEISRFYVVASDNSAIGGNPGDNSELASINGNIMYTVQEQAEGGLSSPVVPMYINRINTSFEHDVPVLFDPAEALGNTYTLNLFRRADGGASITGDQLFSSGESFYLEDRVENEVIEIIGDFSYTFTVDSYDLIDNRFAIYYGEPSNLNTIDVNANGLNTLVYRVEDNYSIKFSAEELGSTTDVTVYNAAGQLVYIAKEVTTSSDFVLPLSKGSYYIVKLVGENGNVVTKKIIK